MAQRNYSYLSEFQDLVTKVSHLQCYLCSFYQHYFGPVFLLQWTGSLLRNVTYPVHLILEVYWWVLLPQMLKYNIREAHQSKHIMQVLLKGNNADFFQEGEGGIADVLESQEVSAPYIFYRLSSLLFFSSLPTYLSFLPMWPGLVLQGQGRAKVIHPGKSPGSIN